MATKKQSIPSYKSPGIFPSGSDESLGIGSSNLFESSLGNWNNLIKNLGPDDKPRVFISFASNAELVTPSINENGELPPRPIYIKITEDLIFNHGVRMTGVKGTARNDWYVEGESGFSNRQRYKRIRGEIKNIQTNSEQFNVSNMARYPYDVIDDYYVEATFDDQSNMDDDDISGASDGQSGQYGGGVSDIEKIHIHELLNRWMYVVMH